MASTAQSVLDRGSPLALSLPTVITETREAYGVRPGLTALLAVPTPAVLESGSKLAALHTLREQGRLWSTFQ